MPTYGNIGGIQQEVKPWYANIDAAQKELSDLYGNVSGAQKNIFTKSQTVSLFSLATGTKFWTTDTEGLSEYTTLGTFTYYSQEGMKCVRTNALQTNILNAVKNCYSYSQYIESGDPVMTQEINAGISSYVNWAQTKAYSYRAYNGRDNNGITNTEIYVFCGWESLDISTNQNRKAVNFFYSDSELRKTINTNSQSNVPCYYNYGYYDYFEEDSSYGYYNDLYYYQSSQKKTAYATYHDATHSVTFSSLPSALYFRPCLVLKDQSVTIIQ